ncbi:Asp-tRNA(Asn)/Glu-tRNA(Gln) amidotransferase subunit GatC [Vulgatibacter sp.]|uniref:Asp-tRNA(Asn)/Glu-tRNA(Gln) amidotransferase subunit GatC n=1 Tax=Vulgatibacter sp. TaxID=1971226 RepID=UPI0035653400
MALTRQQVEHVAKLARLSLSADEVERYSEQLSSILGYIEKLQELDVGEVPPTTHAVEVASTPLRADVPRESLTADEALANAPQREGTHFLVPRILE